MLLRISYLKPHLAKEVPKMKKDEKIIYTESGKMLNPPKGYKKKSSNQPNPKKVKAYYSKKKG